MSRRPAPAAVDEAGRIRRLQEAVGGLRTRHPELSASNGLWAWQRRVLVGAAVSLAGGLVLAPEPTLIALLALLAFPFLCVVILRSIALWQLRSPPPRASAPPIQDDAELPLYTILVPLFREAGVVPQLVASLRALDYPPSRLEVMLIVEEVDHATQAALSGAGLDPHMQVVVVPEGQPRTKPRATQYAMQLAKGEYVVVYDAEDAPQPDQLRRALAGLRAGGERLGCLQAQLNIDNSDVSWFTRAIMAQTPQEL